MRPARRDKKTRQDKTRQDKTRQDKTRHLRALQQQGALLRFEGSGAAGSATSAAGERIGALRILGKVAFDGGNLLLALADLPELVSFMFLLGLVFI